MVAVASALHRVRLLHVSDESVVSFASFRTVEFHSREHIIHVYDQGYLVLLTVGTLPIHQVETAGGPCGA